MASHTPLWRVHEDNTSPINDGRNVFVFGSNLSGIHGAGAAKYARSNFGAVLYQGIGRTGNAYAVPTKGLMRQDRTLPILSLAEINGHVRDLLSYATAHPELLFFLTRVGCGLSGYKDDDIVPMFKGLPANFSVPSQWATYLRLAE